MRGLLLCLSAILIPGLWAEEEDYLSRIVLVAMTEAQNERVGMETEEFLEGLYSARNLSKENVFSVRRGSSFHGAWTFFPLFASLNEEFLGDKDWFVFLYEDSRVNPDVLVNILRPLVPDELVFVGNGIQDLENTVIHHYDDPGFSYPAFGTGFAMSFKLVEVLSKRIAKHGLKTGQFPSDFSIDPLYELAKVVHHSHDDGSPNMDEEDYFYLEEGPLLKNDTRFCLSPTQEGLKCATYREKPKPCHSSQSDIREIVRKTLFAVKTCEAYHKERLPVVKDTWAQAALNILYVSEKDDPFYETKVLPGVINTQSGHCQKTYSILKHFNLSSDYDWLVITDDDTILSVQRMAEALACYSPVKPIGMGQRYGFRIATGEYGYDYITGGGGMVFSKTAVKKMLAKPEFCTCRRPDQPDDMHLGACMSNIGVPLVHHQGFHQARPEDYVLKLLLHQRPLSFHKFLNTNPRKIYKEWFFDADADLKSLKFDSSHLHQEL